MHSTTQDKLNELVSVHLGRAGDGTVVKPYVTPNDVDSSLLVSVPRSLNREQYNIKENDLPFVGVDAWNAYEFSTLLGNGFPISGWLKFTYPSDTPNIVESKSVKLYLNSYNMARLINSTSHSAINSILNKIEADLSKAVGGLVRACLQIEGIGIFAKPIIGEFISLEDSACRDSLEHIVFNDYNENSDILEPINAFSGIRNFHSRSLRSNCRVTNQPDWGDVFIHIDGDMTVTSESLLKYIVSMRNENHFHEEIAECIYKRLWDLLEPKHLFVACLYTRRGGIDINPIRASDRETLSRYGGNIIASYVFCNKTMRQ